ncbi:MAG: prephenate dehydratase [Alphaproteobacteria bacterium]|nr:prephenate dehydratase [Alphaproteobacteria bacterium]
MSKTDRVACQGIPGAFSYLAAKRMFPEREICFYSTFEAALTAVSDKEAFCAVLPVENSAAGRVTDMHRLLADMSLYVIAEHFLPVRHCLLGTKETDLEKIRVVRSHPQALSQCRLFLKSLNVQTEAVGNTALAAKEIAALQREDTAAIASEAAAELYGLKVLQADIQDFGTNTTRFWVLSRTPAEEVEPDKAVTSFVFWVKNKPAALYKCLGGFATNGIDLLRLESYVDPERFLTSAGFLVDVAAHQKTSAFQRAMEELAFFSEKVKILGTYPADPYRIKMKKKQEEMSV